MGSNICSGLQDLVTGPPCPWTDHISQRIGYICISSMGRRFIERVALRSDLDRCSCAVKVINSDF